jgi:hypothetical protein
MTLHHTCHQPSCINPDHLEPITNADHARLTRLRPRDEALGAVQRQIQQALDASSAEAARCFMLSALHLCEGVKSLTYDAQARIADLFDEDPA